MRMRIKIAASCYFTEKMSTLSAVFLVLLTINLLKMEKTVLVCLGKRNRPVNLTSSSETSDLEALDKAVRTAFQDVLTPGCQLILQVYKVHAE